VTEAETVLLLTSLLHEQLSFCHVRYGDGDVFFATGTGPTITGDGEEWSFELSQKLKDAWFNLECPEYLALGDLRTYAVSDGCEAEWDQMLEDLTAVRHPKPIELVHMEALRVGFGFARPFYEAVRDDPRRKVYVAPPPLGFEMAPRLNAEWLGVPLRVAWMPETVNNVLSIIEREKPEIVLFSAGRGGKIMQGKLACLMPEITQIDVGSGLDLLVEGGVRRGTDLRVNRAKVLNDYREVGLCP